MSSYKQYRDRVEMEAAGWKFPPSADSRGTCRECGEIVDWVISPKGKNIPLNPDSSVVHFVTCSRKSSSAAATTPPAATARPAPVPPAPPADADSHSAELARAVDGLTNAIGVLAQTIHFLTRAVEQKFAQPGVEGVNAHGAVVGDADVPF
jgi:hypothetical protein